MAGLVTVALRRIMGFEGLEASEEIVTEIGTGLAGKNRDEIRTVLTEAFGSGLSDARAIRYARAISMLAELTQAGTAVVRVPLNVIYDGAEGTFKLPLLKRSHTNFKKTMQTMWDRWKAMDASNTSVADFIRAHNLDYPPGFSAANPPTFEQLRKSPDLFLAIKRGEVTQTARTILLLLGPDAGYIDMLRRPLKRHGWFGIDKLLRHVDPGPNATQSIIETVQNATVLRDTIVKAMKFMEDTGAESLLGLPDGLIRKLRQPGQFPGIPAGTRHPEYYEQFQKFLRDNVPNYSDGMMVDEYFSYLMAFNVQRLFKYYCPMWKLDDLKPQHVSRLLGSRRLDDLMAMKEIMACILLIFKEADLIIEAGQHGSRVDLHKIMLDYFYLEGSADIFEKMFRRQSMEHGYLFEVRAALVALIHFPAEKILLQSRIGNRCASDMIILTQGMRRITDRLTGKVQEVAGEVATLVQMKAVARIGDLLRLGTDGSETVVKGEIVRQLRSDVHRLLIGFLEGPDALPLNLALEGFSNVILFKLDWHHMVDSVSELKMRQIRELLLDPSNPLGVSEELLDIIRSKSNQELLYETANLELLAHVQEAFKRVYLMGTPSALARLNEAVAKFEDDLIDEMFKNDGAVKGAEEVITTLTEKFSLHLDPAKLDLGDQFTEILDILRTQGDEGLEEAQKLLRLHFRNRFNCSPDNPLKVNIEFLGHASQDAASFLGR